jgi:hypothetical protein
MGHLLKLKEAHSPWNIRILSFNNYPVYTYDGGSAKLSTNLHEMDYNASYRGRCFMLQTFFGQSVAGFS